MSRPLFDSEYLFGLHDPGGEQMLLDAGKPGWIVCAEAVGCEPENKEGVDFTLWSRHGLGVICRINHGFPPEGTIPHSSLYEPFSRRVANFVAASPGCKIWVIGNEMNYAVERPGVQVDWSRHASTRSSEPTQADPRRRGLVVRFNVLPDHSTEIRTTRGALVSPGEVITPEMYARCYRLCRDAIHRLPGHADDQVLVGAVAPWNSQTIYTDNANGDWIQYFRDILDLLGAGGCDGFVLHAYTHGGDPSLITSEEKLGPPYQNYHSEFRAYTDFMAAVPEAMRRLPVYITETDQGGPWLDVNSGWVKQAYAEINGWNQQPANQQIRALVLYRWPKQDRWHISGKTGVMEDIRDVLKLEYRWRGSGGGIQTPEQARAAAKAAAKVVKLPAYRAQWIEDRFPGRLTAGQMVTVPITVKNTGTETWAAGDDGPVVVAYRYYRNRRVLVLGDEKDVRTPLEQVVAPDEMITVLVRIALPDQPGNYTLEVDLLSPAVGSFKAQGSPVLTRWLTAEAPRPEPSANGSDGAALPVPLFADLSAALPRAGTPYARRGLNQIRQIVISHTGANPRVGLDRIAETHVQYGYPGIAYQFVVDGTGQVFKVSNLEDVAQPDQGWSEQGVNICLAGNFTVQAPPLAQLDATGRLCAWLAQNLGLAADGIVGLGELTKSESPGETFYKGPAWKQILSRQVRLHLAAFSGAGDTNKIKELQATLEEMRARNRELTSHLKVAEDERMRLDAAHLRLQAEMAEVVQRLNTQTAAETAGGIRIYRWMDRLPRDRSGYRVRRTEDVRYIVIHHTGTDASVSLPDLAAAHRTEWPGLLFDFVIDHQGDVFQTQPLDQVVDTHEDHLTHGIGLAFAGDLMGRTPTSDQIAGAGKLIAWLMERYPQLALADIKGLREFSDQPSPGDQWDSGQNWKEMLLVAVRRGLGVTEPSVVEGELRAKIGQLEHESMVAQRAAQLLQEQKARLQVEQQRLQAQMAERRQETKAYVIPQPAMRVVMDQLPKHPTLRYERRPLSQITHLAIHHTATPPTVNPARIAELHVSPDSSRGKEAWPGIGYHYFVHADGSIDQTNHLEAASYHVHRHNVYSVGIVFAGSFMNGKIPTSAQLRAGGHLVAWLMQELNIPLARIWGHREFPDNTTVCPGSEWTLGNRWRDLLFERIEQIQAGVGVKNIRHYLLFWQRSYPGPLARQDFVNAINYVVRFRPTLGFSVQDARNAEYVTIVGNEAGISGAEEKSLRNSGCRVERVAGRDDEETSRMLAELANLGRRFRSFEVDF